MAILIDPKGLLWGKRLRRLSNKARLFYPLILGVTNFYARIELDEPCILSNFTSFKDPDLTEENLTAWFNEYVDAGLAFRYKAGTQTWIQFDTPLAMRKSFPTAEDNSSPAPPERDYTAWLTAVHGEKWAEYDLSGYQQTLSEKRADAGRKGGNASGEAKRTKTNGASASEPVVVAVVDAGDVVGVDEVKGVDAVAVHHSTLGKKPPINSNSTSGISGEEPALLLVREFRAVLESNPGFDAAKLPPNWETLWCQDFAKLTEHCGDTDEDINYIRALMAVSQTPAQAKYNVTARGFLSNIPRLEKLFADMHAKGTISTVWDAFNNRRPSFDIEDEDDELA